MYLQTGAIIHCSFPASPLHAVDNFFDHLVGIRQKNITRVICTICKQTTTAIAPKVPRIECDVPSPV